MYLHLLLSLALCHGKYILVQVTMYLAVWQDLLPRYRTPMITPAAMMTPPTTNTLPTTQTSPYLQTVRCTATSTTNISSPWLVCSAAWPRPAVLLRQGLGGGGLRPQGWLYTVLHKIRHQWVWRGSSDHGHPQDEWPWPGAAPPAAGEGRGAARPGSVGGRGTGSATVGRALHILT